MKTSHIRVDGLSFPVHSMNTLIIGSGAAALNAAVRLHGLGQTDIAVATENWGAGTSNNAGSDKQTYYKQSLSGSAPDSALLMAQDLFKGGCMHGDIALCEAQNSLQAFFHLVELGVPFPHDKYGAFIGYKTDHDPLGRGTSAGPLTSHLMFSTLAEKVKAKEIPVFDRHDVIGLLTEKEKDEKRVIGALALDRDRLETPHLGFVLFNAVNVIMGTGGPGGLYRTSVYPESQIGSTGMALEIGAVGHNLTESQFGLASTKFRWNLSGTYQQVIPRYVSTDSSGGGEREFLNEVFPDMGRLATAIFLKGYQWPFDPRKVAGYGSSLIDLLVYREIEMRGRRVWLDFLQNPGGEGILDDFSFALLEAEAYDYLGKSDALFGTPIERLARMNQPAIDLYRDNGIDLARERLEIAVCAQHNNGGLKGNIWWESNVKHLFPIGEVAGTHGVYRPGGSALNAGQVGGMQASRFIAARYASSAPDPGIFAGKAEAQIRKTFEAASDMIDPGSFSADEINEIRQEIRDRMTAAGGHIRDPEKIQEAIEQAWTCLRRLKAGQRIPSVQHLPAAFRNLDLGLTHVVYLEAIAEYMDREGRSRGSYLILDPAGDAPCSELGEEWRFSLEDGNSYVGKRILEIFLDGSGGLHKRWVGIRPLPEEQGWFEKVWNEFRSGRIIIEEDDFED